ncbi:MAG: M24 family metallopeptidase, partial [Candidatus Omnitrophica bacterium]|nr:M24 family metallopeptidase [Candidatus Omnitrophota bacterium]
TLAPAGGTIEGFRKVKTAGELQKMREATRIAREALEFCRGILSPGIKELEVAAEIERFIRYNGAYGPGFETIVASGPNSSRPHHLTSSRRLCAQEPVIIDLGVDYQGYNSDLTRTFFLGKMTPLFSKVYAIANEAQRRAIAAIRPQVFANKVDTCARQYITRKGYGGFFTHSLGHGVGLEVHEAPRISGTNCKDPLKTGMVFTVEPGIYLPGKFGVRIEDMVLVTRKGCEVLSGSLNQ